MTLTKALITVLPTENWKRLKLKNQQNPKNEELIQIKMNKINFPFTLKIIISHTNT